MGNDFVALVCVEPLVLSSSRRVTWSQDGRALDALLVTIVFVASALLIEAMESPDKTEETGGLVKSDWVLCLFKAFGWALACTLGRTAVGRGLAASGEELRSTVSCSIFLQRIILNERTDGEEER